MIQEFDACLDDPAETSYVELEVGDGRSAHEKVKSSTPSSRILANFTYVAGYNEPNQTRILASTPKYAQRQQTV